MVPETVHIIDHLYPGDVHAILFPCELVLFELVVEEFSGDLSHQGTVVDKGFTVAIIFFKLLNFQLWLIHLHFFCQHLDTGHEHLFQTFILGVEDDGEIFGEFCKLFRFLDFLDFLHCNLF